MWAGPGLPLVLVAELTCSYTALSIVHHPMLHSVQLTGICRSSLAKLSSDPCKRDLRSTEDLRVRSLIAPVAKRGITCQKLACHNVENFQWLTTLATLERQHLVESCMQEDTQMSRRRITCEIDHRQCRHYHKSRQGWNGALLR